MLSSTNVPRLFLILLTTVSSAAAQSTRDAASYAENDGRISEFAEHVLTHVVLHELGHALVREFDLPILGNEETLADSFATHHLITEMPDQAFDVLSARVKSLMIEASEIPRSEWTVKGEHNSDARRAYQIVALAIAANPEKYSPLAPLVQMNERELRGASDYGTEIHRSWRRVLRDLRMPNGQLSNEARVTIDPGSSYADSLREADWVNGLAKTLRRFDWHSGIRLFFAEGEGGAGWSRSKRTITVRDEYIERFVRQGKLASR